MLRRLKLAAAMAEYCLDTSCGRLQIPEIVSRLQPICSTFGWR